MKRLIAALFILGLILSVCLAEKLVTDSFEKATDSHIADIKSARLSGEDDICIKNIEKLKTHFENNELYLSIFTNKEIIDDIERSVYRLLDYSESEDDSMFMAEVSTLETEMRELKRSSGIYFNSVF